VKDQRQPQQFDVGSTMQTLFISPIRHY